MRRLNIGIVAKEANVSPTTVSRVLNNSPLVKPATVEKVRAVIEELGYSPNGLARGLRVNETRTVGVIVSNVLNPFFTSVVRGIEDVANTCNYNIMLCNTDERPEKEIQYIQTLNEKKIDGLIIASSGGISDYSRLIRGIPVVFIDRYTNQKNELKADYVLVKNAQGAYAAVSHLLQQGFGRIGMITGQSTTSTGAERLEGYKAALKDAGIRIDDRLIKIGDFLGQKSYRMAMELLTQTDCDAIFSANNLILMEVLRAINDRGKKIPEELGIISFDDMEWMQCCRPRITAVRQPTYEIGETAMRLLLDRIAGADGPGDKIVMDTQLIIRESSIRKGKK